MCDQVLKKQTAEEMARKALRGCIKRYARHRVAGESLPAAMCWPERQLLFSLVHEMVCQSRGYDPLLDGQLRWASWFLRRCEEPVSSALENEDAWLMMILGDEMPKCGKDAACGRDDDHDSGDDLTYAIK